MWLINGECDSSTNLAKTTFAKDFNKIEVVCSEFADPGHAGFDWLSVFVPYGFIWIHIAVAAITRFSLANKVLSTLEMLNRYINWKGYEADTYPGSQFRNKVKYYIMILFCIDINVENSWFYPPITGRVRKDYDKSIIRAQNILFYFQEKSYKHSLTF